MRIKHAGVWGGSLSFSSKMWMNEIAMFSNKILRWIWGSHSSGYEEFYHQEYNSVLPIGSQLTFQRNKLVDFQWTTWCYIPEDRTIQNSESSEELLYSGTMWIEYVCWISLVVSIYMVILKAHYSIQTFSQELNTFLFFWCYATWTSVDTMCQFFILSQPFSTAVHSHNWPPQLHQYNGDIQKLLTSRTFWSKERKLEGNS
jgi:hypothetical protein